MHNITTFTSFKHVGAHGHSMLEFTISLVATRCGDGLTWFETLACIISIWNGLKWSERMSYVISKWSGLTWSEHMACIISKWIGLTWSVN